MKPIKLSALALLAVPGMAMAQTSAQPESSDPTVTIVCFGSDLALTAKPKAGDIVQLSAEVLDMGDARRTPVGRVRFFVNGVPVGPSDGVALTPGQDPRTQQPAGIASISLSTSRDLRLGDGTHTVTAQYIPSTGVRFSDSRSRAANNLQVRQDTQVAAAPASLLPDQRSALAPTRSAAAAPVADLTNAVASTTATDIAQVAGERPVVNDPPVDSTRFWFDAEALYWRFPTTSLPTVSGGVAGTSGPTFTGPTFIPTAPGFIGLVSITSTPTTNTTGTIGGGGADPGFRFGQAYRMGYWLNPEHSAGVDLGGFLFLDQGVSLGTAGGGVMGVNGQILARPTTTITNRLFVNTTPDVFVGLTTNTITDGATGNVNASTSSSMWGVDANYRMRIPDQAVGSRFELLGGLRYVGMRERLTMTTSSGALNTNTQSFDPALGIPSPQGNTFTNSTSSLTQTLDTISASNDFVGAQIGASAEQHWGRWWMSGQAKAAVGVVFQRLDQVSSTTNTTTTTTTPTAPFSLAGIPLNGPTGAPPVTTTTSSTSNSGLLGQSGSTSRSVFAVVPSGDVHVGYELVPNVLSIMAGFSFLYLSDAVRPTGQSDFFVWGGDVGMKVRF